MAVYGIDLGTCYSCIARNDGAGSVAPITFETSEKGTFIPSVVYYHNKSGVPIVGNRGKSCLSTQPERTKAFVKREMDKDFCESEVLIVDNKRQISPIEPSACILKYLVDTANRENAGRPAIHQAVITIPAKFDEKQRARTKLAAELAGIEVLGLIQEPTAAAVAYDIPAGYTVLVFDLGGGTLDISIVTRDKDGHKIIGTPVGDGHLGGMDWDEKIVELAFRKIGRRPDRSNQKEWNRFMSKAEKIKQALSGKDDVVLDYEVLDGVYFFNEDEEIEIERSEFESACVPLLERCWAVVDKAIANAKAENPNLKIDFFLTVGGSSIMPMIRKGLAARYGAEYGVGKAESDWLRINKPETAIAIGAAKYAQLLLARKNTVNDKATHSYGILIKQPDDKGVMHDVIKNLIKADDPITIGKKVPGNFTLEKSARAISIEVYETDSSKPYVPYDKKLHKPINSEAIQFGKEMPAETQVAITINRDSNGLIKFILQCGDIQKTVDATPYEHLIDAETRKQIEHSLSLMEQNS